MTGQFYVEIWRFRDGHVDQRMGPMTEFRAERVQRGVMINMNYSEWGCRIVPAPPVDASQAHSTAVDGNAGADPVGKEG